MWLKLGNEDHAMILTWLSGNKAYNTTRFCVPVRTLRNINRIRHSFDLVFDYVFLIY